MTKNRSCLVTLKSTKFEKRWQTIRSYNYDWALTEKWHNQAVFVLFWCYHKFSILQPWSPFLDRPGNFSCAKANFEIKSSWTVPQFLAHKFKPINFASITDSFNIVSFQNYWNSDVECKHGKHKTTFRAERLSERLGNGPLKSNNAKMEMIIIIIIMTIIIIIMLGHCWENLSVPHSQQDWWKSSQPARCTNNLQPDLLGSFPANVRPDITGHFGCGLRAKFRPTVGHLGGGRFLTNNTNNTILDTKSPQTTWIVYFQGNLSYQGHQLFQISQPAYFEEQIHWVPLEIVTVTENPKFTQNTW